LFSKPGFVSKLICSNSRMAVPLEPARDVGSMTRMAEGDQEFQADIPGKAGERDPPG
jgi:hypothetical protein